MNRGAAVGVVVLGFGIVVAVVVGIAAFGTSSDEYGRVAVPGSATLTLEEGEVEVFYAENSTPEDLTPPSDLQLQILDADGAPIEIRRSSGTQISGTNGTAVEIGEITAAEGQPVLVRTRGGSGRSRPEVTLGRDPFEVIGETLADVASSPLTYLLAAIALVALIGVGSIRKLGGVVLRGGHEPGEERRRQARVDSASGEDYAGRSADEGNPDLELDFSTGKPYKREV